MRASLPSWSPRADAVLVFAVALLPRLALLATGRHDPVVQIPMLDAEYAVDWARQIATGNFWGSPEGGAYFRPPLYPWFLAAAFRLPGPELATARLLQALLGAFTAVFLAGIARHRFGRVAGWATAGLAAFAWPLLFFGREFLIAPLELFLVAALLRVWDRTDAASGTGRWLALGTLIGAGALARPNLLAAAPAAFLVALLGYGPGGARRALILALGGLVVIAPITVRNRLVSGDWVLLGSQGGINLWIGNHPDADGMTATLPGFSSWRNEDVSAWLARQEGRPLRAAEEDARFRALFLARVRDDPAGFLRGLLRKSYLFAQGWEIRNNRDLYAARTRDRLLALPLPDFGWLAPLAVLGLWSARRRARELAFLWAHVAAAAAGVILVFVCARYRLAAWPGLLVFSGAGVASLVAPGVPPLARSGRLGLLALVVVLTQVDFLHVHGVDWAQTHLQWANSYVRAERYPEAAREFDEALRLRPDMAEARHHRGALLLLEGRPAEALGDLRVATANMPFSFRARRSLAEALEALGRTDEALAVRREALELSAGETADKLALATTLGMAGRYAESFALFRELEPALGADPYFLLNAGQTALALRQEEAGLTWLRRATAFAPTAEDAWAAIASYQMSRRDAEAAKATLTAGLAAFPDSARLLVVRSQVRFFAGDRDGALADVRRALAIDPANAEARRGLAALGGDRPSAGR